MAKLSTTEIIFMLIGCGVTVLGLLLAIVTLLFNLWKYFDKKKSAGGGNVIVNNVADGNVNVVIQMDGREITIPPELQAVLPRRSPSPPRRDEMNVYHANTQILLIEDSMDYVDFFRCRREQDDTVVEGEGQMDDDDHGFYIRELFERNERAEEEQDEDNGFYIRELFERNEDDDDDDDDGTMVGEEGNLDEKKEEEGDTEEEEIQKKGDQETTMGEEENEDTVAEQET